MDDSGIRGPPFDLGNPQRVHERCATTPNGLKLGGSEFLMRVMGPVASRESAVLMEIWSMAFFYLRSMILCHLWLFQYVKYVKSHTLPGGDDDDHDDHPQTFNREILPPHGFASGKDPIVTGEKKGLGSRSPLCFSTHPPTRRNRGKKIAIPPEKECAFFCKVVRGPLLSDLSTQSAYPAGASNRTQRRKSSSSKDALHAVSSEINKPGSNGVPVVGHTHGSLDRFFSRIRLSLVNRTYMTLTDLAEISRQGMKSVSLNRNHHESKL